MDDLDRAECVARVNEYEEARRMIYDRFESVLSKKFSVIMASHPWQRLINVPLFKIYKRFPVLTKGNNVFMSIGGGEKLVIKGIMNLRAMDNGYMYVLFYHGVGLKTNIQCIGFFNACGGFPVVLYSKSALFGRRINPSNEFVYEKPLDNLYAVADVLANRNRLDVIRYKNKTIFSEVTVGSGGLCLLSGGENPFDVFPEKDVECVRFYKLLNSMDNFKGNKPFLVDEFGLRYFE